MTKTCFYFNLIFLLLLMGCSNLNCFDYSEEVTLSLPQWPPQSENENLYPELSRWLIDFTDCSGSKKIFVLQKQESINLTVHKNEVFSVTAVPLTLDSSGHEIQFFKAAGFIYPYCDDFAVTWENGFVAEVLKLAANGNLECNPKEKNKFLMSFNWNRFMDVIQEKTEKGLAAFENGENSGMYNPWKKDSSKIAQLICSRKFYQTALNFSGTVISADKMNWDFAEGMLSSYIPENKIIEKYGMFTVQSDEINFYSIYNKFGVIIKDVKSGKISPSFINLPIFKE